MFKKICIGLMMITILTGCSNMMGKDEFVENVQNIGQLVDQRNWDESNEQGQRLLKTYKSNKWKLQLMGDEGEYEQLFRNINRLLAAIEEKDNLQAKLELAMIQAIVDDIYSL